MGNLPSEPLRSLATGSDLVFLPRMSPLDHSLAVVSLRVWHPMSPLKALYSLSTPWYIDIKLFVGAFKKDLDLRRCDSRNLLEPSLAVVSDLRGN